MMLGELAALGAALSWAASAVLYKDAMRKTNPRSANIVRLSSTSVILMVFTLVAGKLWILMDLPPWTIFLSYVSGVIGLGLGDTLYMKSLKLIGVARAVPITCIYPLFNLVWAVFLSNETITAPIVFGAILIVSGIWLLSQREEEGVSDLEKEKLLLGVIFALLTAIFWSISITIVNLAVKETADFEHALAINVIRTGGIGASLLASAPLLDGELDFLKIRGKTFLSIVFGGTIAVGLGWFLLTYSFIEAVEVQVVPISSTTPLFSTLSAALLLHEKVTVKNSLGSIAVVGGIILLFVF